MDQIEAAIERLHSVPSYELSETERMLRSVCYDLLEAISLLEDRIRNLEMLEEHSRPRNR